MNEMIERAVKKAIAHFQEADDVIVFAEFEHGGHMFVGLDGRIDVNALVCAVVEAIREPTPAMIADYDGPGGEAEWGLEKNHADFITTVWQTLIDHILKRKKGPGDP